MVTTSQNGSFGADHQTNTPTEKTESSPNKAGASLKVCSCGNTIREDIESCPQCFRLTESAKDLLLG